MEMRWAARPRRRGGAAADQPSFSSTLLDAICDSMDEGDHKNEPSGKTAAARKRQEAAMSHYYYKPSLAASHRAAPPPANGAAEYCSAGRGYFSSSEVEYSLRRLRPICTSSAGGACGGDLPAAAAMTSRKHQQQRQYQPPDLEKKTMRTAVAVAAAVAGCLRIPVMEVEAADTDGGEEESSDASSDLFELDSLAAIAPANFAGDRGGSYGDELPVYGTTGVGTHRDIGRRRRPYGYALDRSLSRVV
uniref:Uncharacterized protein n=1 Tax=Leersia perrieri TaxID=77586 RepID=A0A0D9XJD9_9ORYZ